MPTKRKITRSKKRKRPSQLNPSTSRRLEFQSAELTEEQLRGHDRQFRASVSRELCDDLAGKFARISSRRRKRSLEQFWTSLVKTEPPRAAPTATPWKISDLNPINQRALQGALECAGALEYTGMSPEEVGKVRVEDAQRILQSAAGIGDIRHVYNVIVQGFRCLTPEKAERTREPLSLKLRTHYQDPASLKAFLLGVDKLIHGLLVRLVRDPRALKGATLFGEPLSRKMTQTLIFEWLGDAQTLRKFLEAIFRRWRSIDRPDSPWRTHNVINHVAPVIGHDRHKHVAHLQSIGAVPSTRTERQYQSELNRVGKHISRSVRAKG